MDYTSIIVAVLSLIGTAVGAYSGCRLTAYRISQLESKVEKLGTSAGKIPVIEEQIKVINHRLTDLEQGE